MHQRAHQGLYRWQSRRSATISAASSLPPVAVQPPRTCSDTVRQAREALRRFRDAKASSQYSKTNEEEPYRVIIELPLPVRPSLLNSYKDADADKVKILDETDWPGGVVQKFRALRPLVEGLVDGYSAQFVGMLESDADGVGVWSTADTTLVAQVNNATFEPFAQLCDGKYGVKPTLPEHTVLAVNPAWTDSRDIGQPWDRKLKALARRLTEEAVWDTLYCCRLYRTGKGASGMLLRSFPGPWQLYSTGDSTSDMMGPCVGRFDSEPAAAEVRRLLDEGRADVEGMFADRLEEIKKQSGRFW